VGAVRLAPRLVLAALGAYLIAGATPALSQVLNACVLTVTTPGILASNINATEISSEQPAGRAATLSVSATGFAPAIHFAAPAMSSRPGVYSRTPVLSIRYTSAGGANQPYTIGPTWYRSTSLTDVITIHAKAEDQAGFAAGTYRIATMATCEQ